VLTVTTFWSFVREFPRGGLIWAHGQTGTAPAASGQLYNLDTDPGETVSL
jgi:hypothetical protein